MQTPTGVHLLIGDVSGHGPDEAALGVALRIAWRALVLAGLPAAEVLRGVEQVLLAERNDDERFATVAMVSLDPALSRAEVVLCGHPAPLLVRGDEVRELDVDRAADADHAADDRPSSRSTVDLDGDWGLLLFTDGLVEGRDGAGRAPSASASTSWRATCEQLVADGHARAPSWPRRCSPRRSGATAGP